MNGSRMNESSRNNKDKNYVDH